MRSSLYLSIFFLNLIFLQSCLENKGDTPKFIHVYINKIVMASNYGDKPWKTKLKRDVFLGQADIKKSRTNNVYIYGNLEVDKKITFKKEISGNTCRLERKNQLLIFSCVDSLNPLKKLRYKTDCKNENFLSANLTKTVDRGNKDFYKEKFMISVGCVNNKKILYKNSKMEPLKESTL